MGGADWGCEVRPRHEQALKLWAQGLLATDIAERMGITASSVRAYIAKERKTGDVRAKLRLPAAKRKAVS